MTARRGKQAGPSVFYRPKAEAPISSKRSFDALRWHTAFLT